ncbi:9846_t:CDS:2 [Funneliformis caledonium]|uniref:9846_t:CDS:1 n=1 Tax=Funneliformis caledonium TaxID=1117310 RepID=A0A9N8V658_9GLOM|nr:9846_t:CDS:2 [Funneliformis caledonium]
MNYSYTVFDSISNRVIQAENASKSNLYNHLLEICITKHTLCNKTYYLKISAFLKTSNFSQFCLNNSVFHVAIENILKEILILINFTYFPPDKDFYEEIWSFTETIGLFHKV